MLNIFLIFCLFASVPSICLYLDRWDRMNVLSPSWAVVTLRIIVFLRPVCLLAIWLWSRTGVVGYIIPTAVAIPACVAVGVGQSVVGCVGVVILIMLVKPMWRYMSWGISTYPKKLTGEGYDA
jgi:hypothetical protein